MPLADVGWKGWAALATFAVQNAAAVLIMRYSKIYGSPYSSQVAVLMQELAVKLPICSGLYALECGGILSAINAIVADLRERPMEWLQLGVPALLYTVQNTMLYVGYANVVPAVGQITYQSKILWTALFSVSILGKKLTATQWFALVVLAAGVVAVQAMPSDGAPPAHPPTLPSHTPKKASHKNHKRPSAHPRMLEKLDVSGPRQLAQHEAPAQSPLLGVAALVLAALCTAFASVYFEKMLKGASKPSLWLRNIQLAIYCSVIAALGVVAAGDPVVAKEGWMHGFDALTWFSALGGILVAVTIKHADNILRGFAQGLALIGGAIGSYCVFSFQITYVFSLGVVLVIAAIFIYGSNAQTPQELCESLAGSLPCLTPGISPEVAYNEVEAADSGDSTASSLLSTDERLKMELRDADEELSPAPSPNNYEAQERHEQRACSAA